MAHCQAFNKKRVNNLSCSPVFYLEKFNQDSFSEFDSSFNFKTGNLNLIRKKAPKGFLSDTSSIYKYRNVRQPITRMLKRSWIRYRKSILKLTLTYRIYCELNSCKSSFISYFFDLFMSGFLNSVINQGCVCGLRITQ